MASKEDGARQKAKLIKIIEIMRGIKSKQARKNIVAFLGNMEAEDDNEGLFDIAIQNADVFFNEENWAGMKN